MGSETCRLHIFFFPYFAHGHTIPMVDIARLFAARGAKSTIIATSSNALHLSGSIYGDRQNGLDIGIQTITFPAVEVGLPHGCENLQSMTSPDMISPFHKATDMLQQPLEKLLEEHRPHCIVSDAFLPWTTDSAHKYGIPRIVFNGSSNFTHCLADNIHHYAPQEKVTSDSEIFVVPGLPDQIELSKAQLPYGTDSNSPIFETLKRAIEAEKMSFGVLTNSFYELEPSYTECYKKEMGRKSWNIGPVSLCNKNLTSKAQRGKKASIDENHCLSWLDSKKQNSVLYVSFGSISRFGTAQLHEIALGLEASQVPFIWVINMPQNKYKGQLLPEGYEERMEERGMIIRDWAPQVLILEHPAVGGFMTHCGWNSTLEGITAGVPLITWPVFAEQFNNEKLITQVLKIGIRAGSEVWRAWIEQEEVSVAKEKVEEVVNELMGDGEAAESRRRRAKELGDMAKKAVEEGGSSYTDLTTVIEELRIHALTHMSNQLEDKQKEREFQRINN